MRQVIHILKKLSTKVKKPLLFLLIWTKRNVRSVPSFVKNHPLLACLFLFLTTSALLPDGKQPLVDLVGAAAIIIMTIIIRITSIELRKPPKTYILLWLVFLLYLVIRTTFSIDPSFSIFGLIRHIEAFIISILFICYTRPKDVPTISKFIVMLALFLLFVSFWCIIVLKNSIPPDMSLIIPKWGHNYVACVVLMALPISIIKYDLNRKRLWLLISAILLLGSFWSLSRAAWASGLVVICLYYILSRGKQLKNNIRHAVMATFVTAALMTLALMPNFITNKTQIQLFGIKVIKSTSFYQNRGVYMEQAVRVFKENQFFGSGLNTFSLQSVRLQKEAKMFSWYTHNLLFQKTADLGLVGVALFFAIIIWALRNIVKKRNTPARADSLGLIYALFLVLFYSLFDINMEFLVVWILFWSIVGTLLSNTKYEEIHIKTKKYLHPSIVVLMIFYTLFLCLILITLRPFSKDKQLISSSNIDLVLWVEKTCNTNPGACLKIYPITNYLYQNRHVYNIIMAEFFEKQRNQTQTIKHFEQAIFWNPQSFDYWQKYAAYLLKLNNPRLLTNYIETISKIVLTPTQYKNFSKNGIFEGKIEPYYHKEALLNKNNASIKEYISVMYYILGLNILFIDPKTTKVLWETARDLSPEWAQFHIELASLEVNIFNNGLKAKQIITNCQKYLYPKTECRGETNKELSQPGFFKERILAIPKIIN